METIYQILQDVRKHRMIQLEEPKNVDYSKLTTKASELDFREVTYDLLIEDEFDYPDLYHMKHKTRNHWLLRPAMVVHLALFAFGTWRSRRFFYKKFERCHFLLF